MSNLSQAECSAGISRKALATIQASQRNGAERRKTHATHVTSTPPEGPGIRSEPPIPERTSVLETWNRNFDILNVNGWSFVLRETTHISDHPHAIYLYLNRQELEMLARKISQVLAETPERSEA